MSSYKLTIYSPELYEWHNDIVKILKNEFDVDIEYYGKRNFFDISDDEVSKQVLDEHIVIDLYINNTFRQRFDIENITDFERFLDKLKMVMIWNG
jgi:hypothetical protein